MRKGSKKLATTLRSGARPRAYQEIRRDEVGDT